MPLGNRHLEWANLKIYFMTLFTFIFKPLMIFGIFCIYLHISVLGIDSKSTGLWSNFIALSFHILRRYFSWLMQSQIISKNSCANMTSRLKELLTPFWAKKHDILQLKSLRRDTASQTRQSLFDSHHFRKLLCLKNSFHLTQNCSYIWINLRGSPSKRIYFFVVCG